MWEHENVFSLVVKLICCWVGGEHNIQPTTGAAKVMDGRDKSDITVAGKGRQKGMAAGGESVDDPTMTKAADARLGGRRRSRRHNNQPSTEGCIGSVGGNNNGCCDYGGKGDGGSKGCEDQHHPAATPAAETTTTATSAGPRALPPRRG